MMRYLCNCLDVIVKSINELLIEAVFLLKGLDLDNAADDPIFFSENDVNNSP